MLGYLVVAILSLSAGLILGGLLSAGKVAELNAQLSAANDAIGTLEHRAAERALYREPRHRPAA